MEYIHSDVYKSTLQGRKARAAKVNKISRLDCNDLEEQLQALQRAFAQERGENHRFREEVRARLRQQS